MRQDNNKVHVDSCALESSIKLSQLDSPPAQESGEILLLYRCYHAHAYLLPDLLTCFSSPFISVCI